MIFKRFLLLTLPSILLKISLNKYNTERNLKILYSHKVSVINQAQIYIDDIGDKIEMQQAKNEYRLELAKILFSDPETGYIKPDKSSDVGISPVRIIERIIKS